jgi:hypothetical protein
MPTEEQKIKSKKALLQQKMGEHAISNFHAWRRQERDSFEQKIEEERKKIIDSLYEITPKSTGEFLDRFSVVDNLLATPRPFSISAGHMIKGHTDSADKRWQELCRVAKELEIPWQEIVKIKRDECRQAIIFETV